MVPVRGDTTESEPILALLLTTTLRPSQTALDLVPYAVHQVIWVGAMVQLQILGSSTCKRLRILRGGRASLTKSSVRSMQTEQAATSVLLPGRLHPPQEAVVGEGEGRHLEPSPRIETCLLIYICMHGWT